MRKLKPIFAVIVVVLGSLYYMINSQHAHGRMYGMGMGQGMMGGSQSDEEDKKVTINSSHVNALLSYIHDQRLQCLQCHAVSTDGFGPSFTSVSIHYANTKNATSIMSGHIEHGIGRMPPGLANNAQAGHLAKLILELTESKTKN